MPKHIYCIADSSIRNHCLPNTSLTSSTNNDKVYSFSHKDISVVIKDTPFVTYEPLPKDILNCHISAHKAVIEGFMKAHTIVPVKFGTIVMDEGEIEKILMTDYPMFKKRIEAVEGKAETRIAALWSDMDAVAMKKIRDNKVLTGFKKGKALRPANEFLSSAIDMVRAVKKVLDAENNRLRHEIAEDIKAGFEGMKFDCKIIEGITDDLMGGIYSHGYLDYGAFKDYKVIVNAAFLLETDMTDNLHEKAADMYKKYNGEINFKVIGPLPPYSFNTIEIKRTGFQDIEDARLVMGINKRFVNNDAACRS